MRILMCTVPIELEDSYHNKTLLEQNQAYVVPDVVVELVVELEPDQ